MYINVSRAPSPQVARPPWYGDAPWSIDTVSRVGIFEVPSGNFTTAGTWDVANHVIYMPILLRAQKTAYAGWFIPGATGTGNVLIGLYDKDGNQLATTGSFAHGTTAAPKVQAFTASAVCKPGLYYIAMSFSNNTDTVYQHTVAAPISVAMGVLQEQPGSFTLPSPATFAISQTLANPPVCGISTDSTVTT